MPRTPEIAEEFTPMAKAEGGPLARPELKLGTKVTTRNYAGKAMQAIKGRVAAPAAVK
jgi:hypothetical protein